MIKPRQLYINPGLYGGIEGRGHISDRQRGGGFRYQKKSRVSCTKCGVTVAASYLKTHMARIRVICVHQTRRVNAVGGGSTTYVVSFPRVLQEVKYPVLGCLSVAHSAQRNPQAFHVPPLTIQGGGGLKGGVTAVPL